MVFLFAVGATLLATGFAIFWIELWGFSADDTQFAWPILGGLGASMALILSWGIFVRERVRWLAFALVAVLVLGLSALMIWTVGFVLLPLGFGLLVVSLLRLVLYSQPEGTSKSRRPSLDIQT